MHTADLRPIGRDTQGVRLMDLADGDQIVSIATLTEPAETEVAEAEVPEVPPVDAGGADDAGGGDSGDDPGGGQTDE
jgi:DNA gyrase/topoisomerase IV subunit A